MGRLHLAAALALALALASGSACKVEVSVGDASPVLTGTFKHRAETKGEGHPTDVEVSFVLSGVKAKRDASGKDRVVVRVDGELIPPAGVKMPELSKALEVDEVGEGLNSVRGKFDLSLPAELPKGTYVWRIKAVDTTSGQKLSHDVSFDL